MSVLIDKVRFHLMRRISSKFLRNSIASVVAKKIGTIENLGSGHSKFVENIEGLSDISKILAEDGIAFLPEKISEKEIDALLEYSQGLTCHDSYRKNLGTFTFDEMPKAAKLASYDRDDLIKNPLILSIANDPGILGIVQEYLGAAPTISSVDMWWSVPRAEGASDAQIFHRDVTDYKFCKLFVYLTDVDAHSGPHLYVKKSVNSKRMRQVKRFTDEEVYGEYGKENIIEIKAPKGTAFLEDTYGFHKGIPPETKPRLVLQVQYSLNPVYGYQYTPLSLDLNQKYNDYINRLFVK